MSEGEFYTRASAVKLDTLADVNDLGKPWRYEDGGYTVTRTSPWSPPGCHPVGCGLKLYVKDGRLEKVEGDENNPVTQGRLCPRCVALKDYLYNPSRELYPMKRDPQYRGQADKWERCTWDQALDLIESEYKRLTGLYGKETVVTFMGTGREGGTFGPMVQMALGAVNGCYTQSGYACYTPRLAAVAYLAGTTYPEWDYAGALPKRWDDERYNLTELLIVWGKAPLESSPDGFFGHAVIDAMRRGMRLVVIDSRVNWLATRADVHVQVRSGTDTAFGMAMLNVIINEDLYDHDFVDFWCYGFEQLRDRVNDPELGMTPEKAAKICGIPVEQVYEVARMYATAKPAAIQWGLAFDQKTDGMQNGHCAISLMAITGNLDVPGGQLLPGSDAGHNEAGFGVSEESEKLFEKMIGLEEYPAYCKIIMSPQADMMLRTLETDEPYPIRFGMYMGNNLMACTSMEPQRWHDAILRSLEFCIGLDTFMTPSIQATCDVFLPLATVAERPAGTVFTHYAPCTVTAGFMNQAVDPGETRSDYEVAWLIGNRLNPQNFEKYSSAEEFLEDLRLGKREGGKFLEKVSRECVYSQIPIEYYKYEKGLMRQDGKPGFPTPTGRVELWSTSYHQFGEDPLPYYIEPHFSPVSSPEYAREFPFVLTTGSRLFPFFHSEHRQIPYLRELHPDPLFEINPKAARALGVADGQWCRLSSPFGSCVQKAHVTESVDEGTIHAEHAWWFPEEEGSEPNLYGVWRSNINNLLPNFHMGKLGFGAPNKCLICRVDPLRESWDTDMELVWNKFGKLR